MKYLTKEWYELCQQTGFHFGKRVHKGTFQKDEGLYHRLKKRKEKAFIQLEEEVYNLSLGYAEEPKPPFDRAQCKRDFEREQEFSIEQLTKKLPTSIYEQIADMRVFALGYCTREVLVALKSLSKENMTKVHQRLKALDQAREAQNIPENLRRHFGFHDCMVVKYVVDEDLVIEFEADNGYSQYDKVIFKEATILQQDQAVEGSYWLYEELYNESEGYEVHILFWGATVHELTLCCKDIIMLTSLKVGVGPES